VSQVFYIDKPFEKRFTVTVAVSSEGMFTCTLPLDIAELFTARSLYLPKNRAKRPGYFSANTLEGLKRAVVGKLKILCSEKLIERTKVIRYGIETACSYAISESGDFVPSPAFLPNSTGVDWRGGTMARDAAHRGPDGIWLYAEPCEKSVYVFEATGEQRTEYKSLRSHHTELTKEDPVQWLSWMVTNSSGDSWSSSADVKVNEVPLTDETAWFFVNLFKSMYALNERLQPFLHPEGIQKLASLAAAGNGLLLGGAQTEIKETP